MDTCQCEIVMDQLQSNHSSCGANRLWSEKLQLNLSFSTYGTLLGVDILRDIFV